MIFFNATVHINNIIITITTRNVALLAKSVYIYIYKKYHLAYQTVYVQFHLFIYLIRSNASADIYYKAHILSYGFFTYKSMITHTLTVSNSMHLLSMLNSCTYIKINHTYNMQIYCQLHPSLPNCIHLHCQVSGRSVLTDLLLSW